VAAGVADLKIADMILPKILMGWCPFWLKENATRRADVPLHLLKRALKREPPLSSARTMGANAPKSPALY
jgi:hypothetical protein